MKLDVYNQDGKKTSTKVELNDKIFGIEPKDHAIWLDVKAIMANGDVSVIGIGESDSEHRVEEAVRRALQNPLLEWRW